jgi:hypothetical protein
VFVADGNFKADHVRQKNADGDVWLSEGAGMIPKRATYHSFFGNSNRTADSKFQIGRTLQLLISRRHYFSESSLSKSISSHYECVIGIKGM